jgi:hypothetical protein
MPYELTTRSVLGDCRRAARLAPRSLRGDEQVPVRKNGKPFVIWLNLTRRDLERDESGRRDAERLSDALDGEQIDAAATLGVRDAQQLPGFRRGQP